MSKSGRRSWWRYPSIRTKLVFSIFIVSLLPALVINAYYYDRTNKSLEEKIRSYNEELLKQLTDKVQLVSDQVMTTQTQLIAYTITSGAFQDYHEKSGLEKLDTLKKTEELLASLKRAYPFISDIYMVGTDNTIYATDSYLSKDSLLGMPWAKEALGSAAGQANDSLLLRHAPAYTLAKDKEVLSFVKRVGAYGNRRDIAMIQIDIDADKFASLLQLMPTDQMESVFLTDKEGRLIYAKTSAEWDRVNLSDDQRNDTKLIDAAGTTIRKFGGTKMLVSVRSVPGRSWDMAVAAPLSRYSLDFRQLRDVLFAVAGLTLAGAVLFSVLLSHGILRQFHTLIRSMRRAGEGNLDSRVPAWNSPDMGVLASSYNTMLDKIRQLIRESLKKEEEKTVAELKALQAQIHPHFLYNTLNSIKWLALSEGSPKIVGSVVSLVKVLRFTYRTNEIFVQVRDELEFIRDYIAIQRLKYGDHWQVEYEWDSRIDDYYSIKFLLQPIVENAIVHGIADRTGDGLIIVRGLLDEVDGVIRFEVEDNGAGFPKPENASPNRMSGVGMRNVDERIRMHFGDTYGVTVLPPRSLNTLVAVSIPILTEGKVLRHA